jgi:hypothetical protein
VTLALSHRVVSGAGANPVSDALSIKLYNLLRQTKEEGKQLVHD